MISSLNDQIAVRILELKAPAHDLSGLALCWLGMGSEGRGEQTIATDQDNGLIFVTNDESLAPDAVRERLLPFARAVNEAMDRCGYPLCKGGVMAMNPRWCASLDEWKAAFAGWIDRGDPTSLLAANIFFDFRALWGESRLADALRADIAAHAQANPRFLKQMSDNALQNRPPLNWRGELQTAEGDSGVEGIDLKMSGSVPFVDAARIFALAAGVTATNTVERLTQAAAARGVPVDEIRAWCDAFEYVQLLRLREQHRRVAHGARDGESANPNVVPLAMLPDLDRRILKEAMRQIRKVQQRLELDYPG
jgi:CBS domain-containing protein